MNKRRRTLLLTALFTGIILAGCTRAAESEMGENIETTGESVTEETKIEETVKTEEKDSTNQQSELIPAAGEIIAVSTIHDDTILTIEVDPGKETNLVLRDETKMITWPDEEIEKAFRENPPVFTNIMALCNPEEIEMIDAFGQPISVYEVETLYIDGMKMEDDQLVMEDGTVVEAWRGYRYTMYQLEDGTEILREDLPVGPDEVENNGTNLDELNDDAKALIFAYYEEQGEQYSVEEEVKAAYQAYKAYTSEADFERYRITQYVLPESVNEEKTTITTLVRKNTGACMQELTWDTVFDSSTGELIE
ncbi:MAG: hypothetical protein IJO55_07130 [Lachnospiraceae bacterium]|nr:hypothetical protein [Lachnospiraceae bacterium]